MVGVSGEMLDTNIFQVLSFTFQRHAPAETKQKKMIRVEVEVGIPKKCCNSSPAHFYTIPFHLEQFPSSNSGITWSHRCIQLSHRQLAVSCRASDLGFEEQKVPDAISFHTCAHHPGKAWKNHRQTNANTGSFTQVMATEIVMLILYTCPGHQKNPVWRNSFDFEAYLGSRIKMQPKKTPSTSSSIIISRKNSNIPFSPHDIGLWRKLQFLTIQVKLQVGQLVQIRTILPRGILLSWNLRQGGWSSTRNSCGRNVREVGPLDGGAPYTQPFWFLLKAGLPSPHLTMFFKCFKVIYHIIPISTNHIQPAPQLEKTQPSWLIFHTSLISPIRWPNCINAEAGAAINEVPLSTMAAQPSWQTSRSR